MSLPNNTQFPMFVILKGVTLRFIGNSTYHRDAGLWNVYAQWQNNKLLCSSSTMQDSRFDDNDKNIHHIYDTELIECTMEEWMQDNEGYLPNNLYVIYDLYQTSMKNKKTMDYSI